MADERDRARARLGLPPINQATTPAPTPKPVVDERTQRAAKTTQTPTATPTPTPTPTPSVSNNSYYVRDSKTGLSPAQVEAQAILKQTQEDLKSLNIPSVVTATPGSAGRLSTPPTTGLQAGYEWYTFNKPGGGFEWRQRPTRETLAAAYGGTGASGAGLTDLLKGLLGGSGSGDRGGGNNEILALLQQQNAALLAAQQQAKIDAAAQAEADKRARTENAISVLTARFSQYNLQSLVPKIRELAISGATEATITLQLQETEEYKQRFRANQERIKKGLAVLDPGDYIGLEDKYRQILRAYGLRQFDNDNYVTQFIANDISSAELSSRVQLAVQRVQNADPSVLNTLTKFYGIGTTDLVAYALDPDTQFQKIERQVAAAEIGAAAGLQGIQPGVAVAEQLAAQGVTQAEARKGYATIADILPGATKLSQIYGNVMEGYGLAEAEQEVFNSLASAQRKRRGLLEREVAAFAGTSGLGKTSLSTAVGGTF